MKALTFQIEFQTAQFREHGQKLTRKTYLIPTPSAIAGIVGAIVGVNWKDLRKFCEEKSLLTGAELLKLGGFSVDFARIFKLGKEHTPSYLIKILRGREKEEKEELRGILTVKESDELYMPRYKIAVASQQDENFIKRLFDRLCNLEFEYEIFGGNDYHFVHDVSKPREAKLRKGNEAMGYCPREVLREIKPDFQVIYHFTEGLLENRHLPLIMPAFIGANVKKEFIFAYKAKLETAKEIDIVDDGESMIFVYEAAEFIA